MITATFDDGVVEIFLDHPPVNALPTEGWVELAETVSSYGREDSTRIVIIAAKGRGFCAGVDIKELAQHPERIAEVNRGNYNTYAAIQDCPVPVIAAVHGFVLGGGVGIVGSSDIVIASSDAYFGLPEIDRGAMGAATHLMQLVSVQKARRMFYTGETATADDVFRFGSIEAVVPPAELLPKARELAAEMASKSPQALRLAKQSINGILPVDLQKSYRFEQGFTFELYTSPDSQEAREAFVEKRDARFKKDP